MTVRKLAILAFLQLLPAMCEADDVEFFETNDLSAYPRLLELSPELSVDAYDVEFEDALEDLINRMGVLRS